ncbi:phosphotransferase [Microlunatus soli]|uniref:Ser/Thr protein kinase RdoA involved in Cpx stress response, MazF antagonist n=1 Tax=Microlunatus soli TaxID=630515 RepID=A0A1H1TBJ5_9ACTN|nr:phosphotransferase [Microlunatus soli]SDS57514.1 Ser/Thr protein kinase RdoA involved in Cpx stress response, MazF antagonist [Microlunatus soli]
MLSTADVGRVIEDDYGRTPTRISLIMSGHNDSYRVETDEATYAFRVYGEGKSWIRGVADLRFELDLLSHLGDRGAPVSTPVARRNGDVLGTRTAPTGDRHYALFTWCPGLPIDADELTLPQAARLGAALASIHVAADDFDSEYARYHLDEQTLIQRSLRLMSPSLRQADAGDARFITETAARISERLRDFQPGAHGWGIIHGDPQTLNCHFTEHGEIAFFDFDHCGFGWRGYDLAYCLRHTGSPGDPHGEDIRAAAVDGYESVRPMSPAEHGMLETLGRAAWIREGTAGGNGLAPAKLARLLRDPYGPWE